MLNQNRLKLCRMWQRGMRLGTPYAPIYAHTYVPTYNRCDTGAYIDTYVPYNPTKWERFRDWITGYN